MRGSCRAKNYFYALQGLIRLEFSIYLHTDCAGAPERKARRKAPETLLAVKTIPCGKYRLYGIAFFIPIQRLHNGGTLGNNLIHMIPCSGRSYAVLGTVICGQANRRKQTLCCHRGYRRTTTESTFKRYALQPVWAKDFRKEFRGQRS